MTENVIIALIAGVASIGAATITGYFAYEQGKKTRTKDKITLTLDSHPYFQRVESLKTEILRTFTLPNKGKEEVFKDILHRQLELCKETYLSLVREIDANEEKYSNNVELYNVHIEALDNIMSQLYQYYIIDPHYTLSEKQVLDTVMQKYARWSQEKIHNMQQQIMLTCNSPFYVNSSPSIKTSILLDQYLSFTLELINSATESLNRINGDLRGLVFKGITI